MKPQLAKRRSWEAILCHSFLMQFKQCFAVFLCDSELFTAQYIKPILPFLSEPMCHLMIASYINCAWALLALFFLLGRLCTTILKAQKASETVLMGCKQTLKTIFSSVNFLQKYLSLLSYLFQSLKFNLFTPWPMHSFPLPKSTYFYLSELTQPKRHLLSSCTLCRKVCAIRVTVLNQGRREFNQPIMSP